MLEIVEVLEPSIQGMQRPYLCRAEDGATYYVKGRQTDRQSLWKEWLCAHMAKALELPIPQFSLVHLSEQLIREVRPEWRDIGIGPAFGSMERVHCLWFELPWIQHVPPSLRKKILAFDLWIRNMDRTDGNANLLWNANASELVVIDHNMAFDLEFTLSKFLEHHVFRQDWHTIDMVERGEIAQTFAGVMGHAQQAVDSAPEEWRWADPECTLEANVDLAHYFSTLEHAVTGQMWTGPL